MNRCAIVYYDGVAAGFLTETDEGYEFRYTDEYLSGGKPRPVSLTLPLSSKSYTNRVLFSFFDGLIPEGWLLDLATQHWKIKSNDRFELLLLTCRDTIGAVTVIPENE